VDMLNPGVTGRSSDADSLWPTRRVLAHYDICSKTLDRWIADPSLGFPAPVRIRGRRYWRVGELAAFEQRRAAKAS
jgi:hypothetical protein